MKQQGTAGTPDFWYIHHFLPKETRDYVPAILAWTRIALDPARFGFKPDGKACRQH